MSAVQADIHTLVQIGVVWYGYTPPMQRVVAL